MDVFSGAEMASVCGGGACLLSLLQAGWLKQSTLLLASIFVFFRGDLGLLWGRPIDESSAVLVDRVCFH